jgi:hypothetical protein
MLPQRWQLDGQGYLMGVEGLQEKPLVWLLVYEWKML